MSFAIRWQLICDDCGEQYDQSLIDSTRRRFIVTMAATEGWAFPRRGRERKALCPLCAVAPQIPLPNITPVEGLGFAPDSVIIKPVDFTNVEIYSVAHGPDGGIAGVYTRERPDA